MIFVTIGTQLPFPRLITAMDGLAGRHGLDVIAQIGPHDGALSHMSGEAGYPPDVFRSHFCAADRVVAHAGIGTILSARRFGKPLILVPRRHDLGEHRNDHQVATATHLTRLTGVYVALDDADLERLVLSDDLVPARVESSPEREVLIARVRDFIDG